MQFVSFFPYQQCLRLVWEILCLRLAWEILIPSSIIDHVVVQSKFEKKCLCKYFIKLLSFLLSIKMSRNRGVKAKGF